VALSAWLTGPESAVVGLVVVELVAVAAVDVVVNAVGAEVGVFVVAPTIPAMTNRPRTPAPKKIRVRLLTVNRCFFTGTPPG
jgi:hypothetical protein